MTDEDKDTFHSRAQSSVDLEMGGRYAREVTTTVIGKDPLTKYPKQAGSWSNDVMPDEPPTGVDINYMPPLGGPPEQIAPTCHEVEAIGPAPAADDGLARQPFVKRRI